MLNKNIFYALAFGLLMTTNVNADNPGEEEVAPVAEVAEVQQEETVQEATASTPVSSSASDSDTVELTKVSVTGSRIKRTDIEGPQPLVVIQVMILIRVDSYQFMKLLLQ